MNRLLVRLWSFRRFLLFLIIASCGLAQASGTSKRITVSNMMKVDTAWFDEGINGVIYQWSYDSTSKPANSKIYYADDFSYLPDDSSFNIAPFSELKEVLATSSSDTIILGDSIIFEDTLILGLWQVAKSTSSDSADTASPGDSVSYKVYIPKFTWQEVNVSEKNSSQTIANGEIVITKTDSSNPLILGKLKGYDALSLSLPDGFILVGGTPFMFQQQSSVPDFIVSLKWDSIPSGADTNQIFFYKYLKGKIYPIYGAFKNSGFVSDTFSQGDIDTSAVYLTLADTANPKINFVDVNKNGDDPVVVPGSNPLYRFTISDNSASTDFKLIYGSGSGGLDYKVEQYYSDTVYSDTQTVRMNDSGSSVNSSFGLRAFIIASDGVNADTENVSLQVFNKSNEKISLSPKVWTPLKIKSLVDSSSIDYIFRQSLELSSWKYDNKKFRLFKYYAQSSDSANYWMEYDSTTKDNFNLSIGDIVWCKSKSVASIDLGKGSTVSLRDYFKIALKPNSWTDFTTPFKFDIPLKDVLKKSLPANISLCQWVYNTEAGGYEAKYIFLSDTSSDINAVTDTLFGSGNDCYTVYNSGSSYDTLYISPLSVATYSQINKTSYFPTARFGGSWNIVVNWSATTGESGDVLCGYKLNTAGRESLLGPLPPSFFPISVAVTDEKYENKYGYMLKSQSKENGGFVYNMKLTNNSDSNAQLSFKYRIEGDFPASFSYCFIDRENGSIIDGENVNLSAGESRKIDLLVGDAEFINKKVSANQISFKFVSLFPNPSKGVLNLKLALPLGVSDVTVAIYNSAGRIVLEKVFSDVNAGSIAKYSINIGNDLGNKISSGLYFISVKAMGNGVSYKGIRRGMILK